MPIELNVATKTQVDQILSHFPITMGTIKVGGIEYEPIVEQIDFVVTGESRNLSTSESDLVIGNDGYIYAAAGTVVSKIDPDTMQVVAQSEPGGDISRIAKDESGFIYIADVSSKIVKKINPTTMVKVAESAVFAATPHRIKISKINNSVYVTSGQTVIKLNPTTLAQEAASTTLGGSVTEIAVGSSVYAYRTGNLHKLNLSTLAAETSVVFQGTVNSLVIHEDALYASSSGTYGMLKKINPNTLNTIIESSGASAGYSPLFESDTLILYSTIANTIIKLRKSDLQMIGASKYPLYGSIKKIVKHPNGLYYAHCKVFDTNNVIRLENTYAISGYRRKIV